MSNYYNNGLYDKPFYAKKKIEFHIEDSVVSTGVDFNVSLLTAYYVEKGSIECSDTAIRERYVNKLFWYDIAYDNTYFQPLIFDEEIALECNLFPFAWREYQLLAVGELWLSILPRLDAYQTLTHKTIDPKSILFSDFAHFEEVVGEELTKKILQLIF